MISPSLKGTNSSSTQLLVVVVVVVTYVLLLLLLAVPAVSHTALHVADNQTQHPIGVLGIVEGKLK
jgi:competence protein ComGC